MIYDVVSSYGHGNEQALETMKTIELLAQPSDNHIVINFEKFRENTPFNVLAIASYLNYYRKQHPEYSFSLIPKRSDNFLSHLGFYQMIGADFGKRIGEARSTANCVPIREIVFDYNFYNDIEYRAKELAKLLGFDKNLEEFISYILVETIRNVYEHAQAEKAFVCAQKWPSKNLVEIAIIDMGVGIAKALGTKFAGKSEKELMYLSMQPGISARSNYSYLEKNNPWRNSGYGLYMLKRLAVLYGGSFLLCSKKCALQHSQEGIREFETVFPGTAIAIHFRTDTGNNFNTLRDQILWEGESEARLGNDTIKKASRSSGGHYNG